MDADIVAKRDVMEVDEAKLPDELEVNSVRNTSAWTREFLLRIDGGWRSTEDGVCHGRPRGNFASQDVVHGMRGIAWW